MDFRGYIRTKLLKKSDRILEFGPLIRPMVAKKDYPNAFFADIRSTEEIKKLYTSNDYLKATGLTVDINEVAEIDYVVTKSYTETFKDEKKFDVVYLSHVIEHMPDIISFFKDIVNVMTKDGKLILIYPDARYCFDHFRNGTTFVDAYDVYKNKSINAKAVLDFTYNVVNENDPEIFWGKKNVIDLLPKNKFKDAIKSYKKAFVHELPDDVHFWPFSDYQFVKFLYDMDRAGLLDFEISEFHETQVNTQEFMIVLTPRQNRSDGAKKYHDIFSRISPAVKASAALKEKELLLKQVSQLEEALVATQTELEKVYDSKRWRYASKAAEMGHHLSRRKK